MNYVNEISENDVMVCSKKIATHLKLDTNYFKAKIEANEETINSLRNQLKELWDMDFVRKRRKGTELLEDLPDFVAEVKTKFNIKQDISDDVAYAVRSALRDLFGSPTVQPTPRPSDQATLMEFWSSLKSVTNAPVSSVLQFKGDSIDFDYSRSGIFVRPCYEQLWGSMQVLLRTTEFRQFLITGTPGIGKSISAIYFLWKLARDNREVIYCRKKEFCLFFFGNSVTQLTWKEVCDYGASADSNAWSRWFIVDANSSDHIPLMNHSKMILICSPKRSTFKEKVKSKKVKRYCMPLWSEEELLKCNELFQTGFSEAKIRERIRQVGLIARYVLDKEENFEQGWADCVSGIADVKIAHLEYENVKMATSIDSSISHRVFHLRASQNGVFQGLDFASPELKVRACSHLLEKDKISALRFVMNSKNKAPVLSGKLFEQIVHDYFRNMTGPQNFRFLSLEDDNSEVQSRTIFFSRSVDVSAIESLHPEFGVYYVPTSGVFPAVDAMSKGEVYHMTLNLNHGIDAPGEEVVLNVFKDDRGELKHCFVVTSDIFHAFRKQSLTRNGRVLPKKRKDDKELHKRLEFVQQYVMEFPIDISAEVFSSKRGSDEVVHDERQPFKRLRR